MICIREIKLLWDVPKAAIKDAKFSAIVFSVIYAEEEVKHFIGNLRLAGEFGISEDRMNTDGKGESELIEKNDTPAGKANNRRVEFIKV
jgi:hypothetical protein